MFISRLSPRSFVFGKLYSVLFIRLSSSLLCGADLNLIMYDVYQSLGLINRTCEVAALMEIFPAEMVFSTIYLHLSTRFPKCPRSVF